MSNDTQRMTGETLEEYAADWDATAVPVTSGHQIVTDWELQSYVCLRCGRMNTSHSGLEATECTNADLTGFEGEN